MTDTPPAAIALAAHQLRRTVQADNGDQPRPLDP
jgi:hypothetical protein